MLLNRLACRYHPAMLPVQVIRLFPKDLQNRNQNLSRLWIDHEPTLTKDRRLVKLIIAKVLAQGITQEATH